MTFPFPSHFYQIIPIPIPIPTNSDSHSRQRLYTDYLKVEKYVYCVVNSKVTAEALLIKLITHQSSSLQQSLSSLFTVHRLSDFIF